eukprot:11246505-Prorocentrum_lima.AAC.1
MAEQHPTGIGDDDLEVMTRNDSELRWMKTTPQTQAAYTESAHGTAYATNPHTCSCTRRRRRP